MYSINLIPQNLRREETYIQIAETLQHLSDITNDIFTRINLRIEQGNKNLNNISERIEKASEKIGRLSESKTAIQVFSSSKYPGTDVNKPYETIFQGGDPPTKIKYPIEYKEVQVKDEPLEKLQFYHITSTNTEKLKSEGLGNPPVELDNVNDFLLYNSGKNPYSEYVISDTLHMSRLSRKQNTTEQHEIGAAPLSISERVVLTKTPGENYFYSPDLGEVPTLDVPIDLPDLPGVAGDLRYIDETGPGIAPSVTTTPNLPTLPQFDIEDTKKPEVIPEEVNLPKILNVPPEDPPKIEPPPIIMEEKIVESIEVRADEPKQPIQPPAPPPEEIKKGPPVEITDVRANLMDAIRKAGGLKNANLRSTEAPAKQEASKGDLMAEFHAKLSLRRKGISGAKKVNEWESGSAMDRISEMIRPPPPKIEQSESATTDEEWD